MNKPQIIKTEHPFSSKFAIGILKDDRVLLQNPNEKISLRWVDYVSQVKLDKKLTRRETLQFIDGNPKNTHVSNLVVCRITNNTNSDTSTTPVSTTPIKAKLNSAVRIRIKTPPISKETLIKDYKNLTTIQLSEKYNISSSTIYNWLEYYNISLKGSSKRPSKEELEQLLMNFKVANLVDHYNVGIATIYNWIRHYNINMYRQYALGEAARHGS